MSAGGHRSGATGPGGHLGYLAMALGMPSIVLAFFLDGAPGMVAGGTAVAFGLLARLRSSGPGHPHNRFRANVGVLTGTVAVLAAVAVDAIRAGG